MKASRSVVRNRSKKRRRKWWNSLNEDQKLKYLEKKAKKRSLKCSQKSDMIMAKMKLSFDCSRCIHGITESCTDRPKNGCTYFYDAVNDIWGPAYKKIA